MAEVLIEGMFLSAEPKTSTYEGNSKTEIVLDIYQQKSKSNEKTVTLKTQDLSVLSDLNENYSHGSVITVKASVNAYKNKAYFKLLEVVS